MAEQDVFWFRRTQTSWLGPSGLVLGPPPAEVPDWVISDTHWGQKNKACLSDRPGDHEDLMMEGWRAMVGPDDTILHLGDVSFKSRAYLDRLAALPGRVLLLRGNHDRGRDVRRYRQIGWTVLEPFIFTWRDWRVLVTHEPQERYRLPWHTLNLHGHLHARDLTDQHLNACVERIGYAPVRLAELLDARLDDLEAASATSA